MANKNRSLCSLFSPVFAYVQGLRRLESHIQPEFSEIRRKIDHLLKESAASARDLSVDPRDYDSARFAVCAWIDETMMATRWDARAQWRKSLLQSELYGVTNAGEEFFERMDKLSRQDTTVREVYYWCLGLGFAGRYCGPGDEVLLAQLKRSVHKQLSKENAVLSGFKTRNLFESAYEGAGRFGAGRNDFKRWTTFRLFFLVVPPLLLAALYVMFRIILSGASNSVFTRISGG